MQRALELARLGLWTTTPNPRVGCVIVREGRVVGEGWHRRTGEPHAEALALVEAGDRARGATVYVTLEPCSHHGRTPPCADSLAQAGVARVIAAMEDPNPLVSGSGLQRLRDAGVDVRCGLLAQEATELNIGFVSRMTRGRPWLRLKMAASLDGRTALPDGRSQWITGPAARADGHAWRARACAVLTGVGTVRDDDPQLSVREVDTDRQPLRVVVDSRFEIPLDARVLRGGGTLVATVVGNPDKEAELRDRGCELLRLPHDQGKVDLDALVSALAERGVNELHVEAGAKLAGSFLRASLVDEMLLYVAPALLGAGPGLAEIGPAATPGDPTRRWVFEDAERVGDDVRLRLRPAPPPPGQTMEA